MMDFDMILSDIGFGKYQYKDILLSFFSFSNSSIQYSFIILLQNSILKEWSIPKYYLIYLSTSEYSGYMIGSLLSGYFGSRFGRKKISCIGSFFLTIFLILIANSNSFFMFVLLRFFCGFLNLFSFLNTYVLVFEFLNVTNRGKVTAFLDVWLSAGNLLLVLYLYLFFENLSFGNWRMVVYLTAINSFLYFLSILFGFDESVRYNLMKRDYEKAFLTINKIAKLNNNNDEYMDEKKKNDLIEWTENFLIHWNSGDIKRNCCSWLCGKELKKITIVLWIVWFCATFSSYQTLYTMTFTIISLNIHSRKIGEIVQLFYPYLTEIFSAFVAMFFIDKKYFGRINSFSINLIIISFILFCIYFQIIFSFIILLSIIRFLLRIAFNFKYIMTTELYPTIVRTDALGYCSAIGRFATIVMPFVVIPLLSIHPFLPYLVSAILCLIIGICIHILPETTNKPLDSQPNDDFKNLK